MGMKETPAHVAQIVRTARCRRIVHGDPYAPERVAQAVEVMDRAWKAGKRRAMVLQAAREARDSGWWKT
jgi:hypothetical protein